jgi:hypothetical protein
VWQRDDSSDGFFMAIIVAHDELALHTRLMVDSRVAMDQLLHNDLFFKAFFGSLDQWGSPGENCCISND